MASGKTEELKGRVKEAAGSVTNARTSLSIRASVWLGSPSVSAAEPG